MTWIALICLLVLPSVAISQGYGGGYGGASIQQVPKLISIMRDQTIQRPFVQPLPTQGYGQQQPATPDWSSTVVQQPQQDMTFPQENSGSYGTSLPVPILTQKALPIQNLGGYGAMPTMHHRHHHHVQKSLPIQNYGQVSQGYGSMPLPQFDQQQQIPQAPVLTPADLLCRGQQPETVIPLEDGRRFVVCLDESKGVEQQCPKGLFYHQQSHRCERKLGPLDSPCTTQPCLNGGQCIPTDSWYQCQCAPGFDGTNCELDARVCQTQQPCGQGPDTKCQSFRLGAALQYICILQDGLAYGLSPQQAVPSPCRDVDGPQALTVSNNGFIMCDGERMFVESCPGGTIWDDLNKACVWPDMQTVIPQQDQQQSSGYGQSYGQQKTLISQPTYGTQWPAPQQFEQPKVFQQYGSHIRIQQPKFIQSSYSTQITAPQLDQPAPVQSSYGSQVTIPQQLDQPKLVQGYGAPQLDQPTPVQPSYGAQIIPQFNQPKVFQAYGAPQLDQPTPVQPSYGAQIIPQFNLPKVFQSYSAPVQQPKVIHSSYGYQAPAPQQLDQPKQSSGY